MKAAPLTPALREAQAALFEGHARFTLVSVLGHGSFGTVYRVLDRARGEEVALKLYARGDAAARRALADEARAGREQVHPSLVRVYDVGELGEFPFCTMELVQGDDFLRYVRPTRESFDEARLRACLVQLVGALAALHASLRVHCDVKPSNVRVTAAGRLVLLDLGSARDVGIERVDGAQWTPAHAAPEQLAGGGIGPAADLYAVGSMLYEALTGRLPFPRATLDGGLAKLHGEPPWPTIDSGQLVPDDLARSCMALLAREPDARPSALRILAELGAPANDTRIAHLGYTPPLVGRDAWLERLRAAWSEASERGGWLHVFGPRGRGKRTLIAAFARELEAQGTSVLRARFERIVRSPHGALDGLAWALAGLLASQPKELWRELELGHAPWLRQMFPAFATLMEIALAHGAVGVPDVGERRRRALSLLGALIARLGATKPLVIWLDDLDLAHEDARLALTALWRRGPPPGVLLLSSGTDPLWGVEVRDEAAQHELERMEPADIAALLDAFSGHVSGTACADVSRIATRAQGEPGLALARAQIFAGALVADPEHAVRARLDALDEGDRGIAQRLALAERAVGVELLAFAAALDDGLVERSLARLERAGLVHHTQRGLDEARWEMLAPVAALVRRTIPDVERRTLERDWALAVARQAGHDGADELYARYVAAGEPLVAAEHAQRAAGRATEQLAFARAADLLEAAMEHDPAPASERGRARWEALADACDRAGRLRRSAAALAQAKQGAEGSALVELSRRRALCLLHAADIPGADGAAQELFELVGLDLPATEMQSLRSLVWQRTLLTLRGLRFKKRDANALLPRDMLHVDALLSMGKSFTFADVIRGADLHARSLRLAFRLGDPRRVARALLLEAITTAGHEGPPLKKTNRILALATELAHPDEGVRAFTALTRGVVAFFSFRLDQAVSELERAEALLRDSAASLRWELATAQQFLAQSLVLQYRFAELVPRAEANILEARASGDWYGATNLTLLGLSQGYAFGRDDVPLARAVISEVMAQWPTERVYLPHFYEIVASTVVDGYAGETDAAARLEARAERLRGTVLMKAKVTRELLGFLRAFALHNDASNASDAVHKDRVRALRGVGTWLVKRPQFASLGWVIRAREALLEGAHDRVLACFERARDAQLAQGQEVANLELVLARLRGGDETRALRAKYLAQLNKLGIANLDRYMAGSVGREVWERVR